MAIPIFHSMRFPGDSQLLNAAKEKVSAIREAQEAVLAELPPNTLYIVLWIRADPPPPNDFHWAFYFHTHQLRGTQYHIENSVGGWMPNHQMTGALIKSNFLCVLVEIASVPESYVDQIDSIIRMHDLDLNSIPDVTCRVWLSVILEKLVENGAVKCGSHVDLMQECMEIGNQHRAGAAMNEQPRPVVKATICQQGP